MPNMDRGQLKRIHRYISYQDSGCYLGASGVGVSTGVGDMVEAEVGSLDIVALVMTAGDEHNWYFHLPRDMNINKPFGIQYRYSTASTTAADTHTFISLYDIIAEDAAYAIGTTAFDTTHVVASDTDSGVANAWQWSTRAVLNANRFSETNLTNGDIIAVNFEFDATDAAETAHLHGLRIDYMPKRYLGNPAALNFDSAHDQE